LKISKIDVVIFKSINCEVVKNYLFFKGWKLRNELQEAIGLNVFLEENQVSLEIAPYEEHQGREYFGTSSDGHSVVEEH